MRIRRKTPKPSRSSRPLFIIGHSNFPELAELQVWFDSQYGGPLRLRSSSDPSREMEAVATHGPWSMAIARLSDEEAAERRTAVGWGHRSAIEIRPVEGSPQDRINQALHAARIARGLTLLTQGTSYDVLTQDYFNPSDWQDHDLSQFAVRDHVRIRQLEAENPDEEWFSTRGLTKFGLEELETFRPRGLSSTPVVETLTDLSAALIRQGPALKVGSTIALPELHLSVRILRHRTANIGGVTLSLREIAWNPLS